ncbi:MAG: hypothetical protein KTR18_10770 [Acidiferrobacterales bacterium]|nr:hypothetical protein [Acidiferrobacterales bacterium]
MTKTTLGLIFTVIFVVLESTQFVFFGNLFQKVDSFLFGFLVFGFTVFVFVGWAFLFRPGEIRQALRTPFALLAVNLGAVVTFTAYLLSVQLLEPAITYTISAGTMPITAYLLYRMGLREGEDMRNRLESSGTLFILCSIIFLAVITILGWSGFVRGSQSTAIVGILLAMIDGVFFTLILVYSQRLNAAGVGPATVLGLRLPLYVLVTGSIALGSSGTPSDLDNHTIVAYAGIGFLLTIPPLYFLQKAVSMLPAITISALTALGPFVIFSLQLIEGRIDYSPATLAGLTIYIIGAVLCAFGAVRATVEG